MNGWLNKKRMLPLVAILLALVAVIIVKTRPPMVHSEAEKIVRTVSTITANPITIRPRITGFGTVEPDIQLPIKSEVAGRIIYVHPNLKKGSLLPAGTELIRVDDKDYLLALKQAEADLLVNKQTLIQSEQTVKNAQLDLELAQQKLSIVEAEYERKQGLHKQGTVSKSELDAQYQQVLQLRQEVQNVSGRLTTLPADIEVIKAKIEIANARVDQAKRDIERTVISLPFSSRISAVNVENNQFVSLGSQLFEASSFDKMLINAQFSVNDFRRIMATLDKEDLDISSLMIANQSHNQVLSGLSATIKHPTDTTLVWTAKVERIADNLDPQTRTIGVVVSVSNNYQHVDPKTNPPLVKGMYLSVELQGKESDYVVLPRSALRQNQLLYVDNNDELKKLDTAPLFTLDDLALFESEALAGKDIIVSELFPAVEGMTLSATPDAKLSAMIANLRVE